MTTDKNVQTVKEIRMYDQSKLSELIRFARVDAGSTVIDVYPGDGDWTRLFSDIVGPEGRVYGFVPAEVSRSNSFTCRSSSFKCSVKRSIKCRKGAGSSLLASSRISGTRFETLMIP
jgi:predicted methyltransferase